MAMASANVDIARLVAFHRAHGRLRHHDGGAPARTVRRGVRSKATVRSCFEEKPNGEDGYINGGFFVLSPAVLDLIAGDRTVWEREPLESLARDDQLRVFRHDGFWQPMDTVRERDQLEAAWNSGNAPWRVWT